MDGRLKRLLAGGVLCTMLGCGHLRDKNSTPPMGSGEPPFAMTDKPVIEDRDGKKDGPIRVETMVVYANLRVQAAADENCTTQKREELCNSARLLYQQSLKREPKNYEAMLGMARMYAVVRDKDKCVEWYEHATKAYPTKGEVWYEMGKTLGSYFKDKEGAANSLHAATKLAPENRTYRTELGFTLAWAGRYDEGFAWLVRTMPEAKARYNIAGIMEHNGQVDQAKMWLAMALQADPNHEPSKQMIAALTGAPREPMKDNSLQNVNYDQAAPAPNPRSPSAPAEPLPLNSTHSRSATEPFAPTGER